MAVFGGPKYVQNTQVCARRGFAVQGSGSSKGLVIRQPRGGVSIAKICIPVYGNLHNHHKASTPKINDDVAQIF